MPDGRLDLTVLGCATPYPTADNPCSGYLVSSGNTHVWMDAGSGTLGPLQRYVRLDELDAIWISHLHADHSADLLTAYYGLLFSDIDLPSPIPLYGPPGTADRLAHFLTNTPTRSPVESAFAVTELYDGHRATAGPLRLTSRAVSHGILPSPCASRRRARPRLLRGHGPVPEPHGTGRGLRRAAVRGGERPAAVRGRTGAPHPEGAAATARTAGAARLIVTHVGRFLTARQAVTRAAARYDGPVEHAASDVTYSIG